MIFSVFTVVSVVNILLKGDISYGWPLLSECCP